MWVLVLILENLNIVLHWRATVEDCGPHLRHIFTESSIFVLDLIGELAGVTHYQHRCLSRDRIDLLKGGQNEDSRLSKTRFGLA